MSQTSQACHELLAITKCLRSEGGCPWDRAQTIASMARYLKNEHEELLAAIARGDTDNLCEELGDVMFVLCLIARIAEEEKLFSVEDVFVGIVEKLRRRHPHVFERRMNLSMEELDEQWRRIKEQEKAHAKMPRR
ncbi:MAG: nucleotide pyrophosphohydrolase [Desulfobulbaceae bacterium]|jgi:tetrapyrrole methylase family protein/MazG family protein|nr:nucleotide pyrophosphohydrolase [Desulfobulbaceae bacterium]